jgi:kynurenine formamidase
MTRFSFDLNGRHYHADTVAAHDLAIRLQFDGPQPGFFGAPPAGAQSFAAGDFTGDTRTGGSCNVEVYRLNPHCNGTHTECVGHIAHDTVTLADLSIPWTLPATLVTVDTASTAAIGRERLERAWRRWPAREFHRALIVRTLPNSPAKQSRRYDDRSPPPYLRVSALELVHEMEVEHLLVDLPSLDAMDDKTLAAHRVFWGLSSDSRPCAEAAQPRATVTEMIYVPEDVPDGYYLLNLQVPRFATDAAPSRPVIVPIEEAV